jgi:hypothetical protein
MSGDITIDAVVVLGVGDCAFGGVMALTTCAAFHRVLAVGSRVGGVEVRYSCCMDSHLHLATCSAAHHIKGSRYGW